MFSAVEASYLDQLQILIITKDGAAQAIQETYTYSFTYLNNAVASVELKEKHQSLSLSDAQRSFKAAIRNLLRSIKDLPQLPGKYFVNSSSVDGNSFTHPACFFSSHTNSVQESAR